MPKFKSDNITYKISEDGDLTSVVVAYKIKNQMYRVSFERVSSLVHCQYVMCSTIKRKTNNPISYLLNSHILHMSTAPCGDVIEERSSIWDNIKSKYTAIEKDSPYADFLDMSLRDILAKSEEIEKNIKTISAIAEKKNALKKEKEEEKNERKKRNLNNSSDVKNIRQFVNSRK